MATRKQPRSRRPTRSRLERLLLGTLQLSKYSLPGVLVSLSGCVAPPSFIAISPDGKHAVVMYNSQGPAFMGKLNGVPLRIDLETGKVSHIIADDAEGFDPVKGFEAAMWLNTSGDTITFTTQTHTVVIQDGEVYQLAGHFFPALAPDGATVYTTVSGDPSENKLEATVDKLMGPIHATKLNRPGSKPLGVEGLPSEVSPDGKYLAYISHDKAPANNKRKDADQSWGIYIVPTAGGKPKRLASLNPDRAYYFKPTWIDDRSLLYRGFAEGSPEDTDLFVTDITGKTRQLTADNTISEAYPQATSDGRLVWLAVEGNVFTTNKNNKDDGMIGRLMVAKPGVGNAPMRVTDLGYKASAFAVHGDKLLFVDLQKKEDDVINTLWMLDLSKPDQPAKNYNEMILGKIKLPAADDG